jgi:hypothetical protein
MQTPIFAIPEEEHKTRGVHQLSDPDDQYVQVTTEMEDPVIGFKKRPIYMFKGSSLSDTEENNHLETNEVLESFRAAKTVQKEVHISMVTAGKTNSINYIPDDYEYAGGIVVQEFDVHQMVESTIKSEANVQDEEEYLDEGNDTEMNRK